MFPWLLKVELIKIVWPVLLLKQIKLDYTAFAVEAFKLVMHFVQVNQLA